MLLIINSFLFESGKATGRSDSVCVLIHEAYMKYLLKSAGGVAWQQNKGMVAENGQNGERINTRWLFDSL